MKRRFYALMLVVAMLAMTLVGCGSDTTDTTNTTNDVTVNTETEESGEDVVVEPTEDPVVEPTTELEVEDHVVEPTEEPTTEEEFYSDSYQWTFPEGMDGFTDKFVLASDETMSFNCTHYVDTNGNEMNFSWVGPTELGEQADAGETTLFLYGGDNYELKAWGCEVSGPEDALREFDKETIVGWDSSSSIYTEGDYYEFVDGDIDARVTFKISRTINDVEYTGYACYFENYETMTCYQITYVERNDIFDDERALSVVNSLDFWTYNSGEIVTE